MMSTEKSERKLSSRARACIAVLLQWLVIATVFLASGHGLRGMARPLKCRMQDSAQLGISFNNVVPASADVAAVSSQGKARLDDNVAKAKILAKQAGIQEIEEQSSNYNVVNFYGSEDGQKAIPGGQYRLSGNVIFNVMPADKAPEFMALLVRNGVSANLSANSFRQCQ